MNGGQEEDLYARYLREKREREQRTTQPEPPSLYSQFKTEQASKTEPEGDGIPVVSDVAAQVFAGPANLVTTAGEGLARLGSNLYGVRNRIAAKMQGREYREEPNILDRVADSLRERRDAVNEVLAPSTTSGKVANVVSNIGAQALPAIVTGGTYGLAAGAAASASLTGVQSQAGRDASITGLVADLTESPALDKIADNPLSRTAADVLLDVGLSAGGNKLAAIGAARKAAKTSDAAQPRKLEQVIQESKPSVEPAPAAATEASDLYRQFKAESATDSAPSAPAAVNPSRRPLVVPIEEPLRGIVGAPTIGPVTQPPVNDLDLARMGKGELPADPALRSQVEGVAEYRQRAAAFPMTAEDVLGHAEAKGYPVARSAAALRNAGYTVSDAVEREAAKMAMQRVPVDPASLPPRDKWGNLVESFDDQRNRMWAETEAEAAVASVPKTAGRLPRNLRKLSDEELEHEWARRAERNAADESAHAAVKESGYRADYEELPRTERLGRRGQEDLPDADGMVDAERLAGDNRVVAAFNRATAARASREKAMRRIEAELARRGRPIGGSGQPFDVFSNPMADPRALARAFASRAGQSGALTGAGLVMQESDDEKIRATGTGLIGLAALHAVGARRIRTAGGAVGRRAVDALRGSEHGVKVLDLISRDILADPKVRALVDAYDEGMAGARARAAELSKQAKALGPSGDRRVSDLIEGENFEPLGTDEVAALAVAQRITDEFTALGRSKVEAGLLSAGTVAKREGRYLPRLYAKHLAEAATAEQPTLESRLFTKKPRIRGDKQRDDMLEDRIRDDLGEIREASFRTAHGIQRGYSDLAAVKLFDGLRELPGVVHPEFTAGVDALTAARASGDKGAIEAAKQNLAGFSARYKNGSGGFVRLPDTQGMGVLRGAVVRKDVADYLNGVPTLGGKAGSFLSYWKRVHTVLNPGTHIGNVASNSVTAHMFGLPIWEQPKAIAAAARDFDSYGPVTKFLAEKGILAHGLPTAGEAVPGGGRTLKTTLTQLAGHTRPETARVLSEHGIAPRNAPFRAVGTVTSKMEDLYAKEDGVFRVATFMKLTLDGGVPADEAAKIVDRAFVNYTTHSPLLGAVKNTISPFVMYPVRAIPAVTEQIIEHPWRWMTLAAMWGGLDQYSRQQVGKIADSDLRRADRHNRGLGYLTPGFTQLPIKSARGDKYGVDLARFTPFSALTGAPAPGSATFAAFGERTPSILQPSGPWIDIGARLTNTDPYTGDKLIKPGDRTIEKALAATKSAASLALPSALSFQAPRVVGDVLDRDWKAAGVDALGFAGMRPRTIRPGMQMLNEEREFEDARSQILGDLRRALKSNRDPARAESLKQDAAERLRELSEAFRRSQGARR